MLLSLLLCRGQERLAAIDARVQRLGGGLQQPDGQLQQEVQELRAMLRQVRGPP